MRTEEGADSPHNGTRPQTEIAAAAAAEDLRKLLRERIAI
jgi:hypothetical protein